MTTLSDLIAKLEAATEGSRELDAAIDVSIRPRVDIEDGESLEFPLYTTSIDAALTLVPKNGRLSTLGQWDDNGSPSGWFCCILRWSREIGGWQELEFSIGIPERDATEVPPLAATPALALCIAALKAREARP